jgi:hypothetical protein
MEIQGYLFKNRIAFFQGNSLLSMYEKDEIFKQAVRTYQKGFEEGLIFIDERVSGTIRNTKESSQFAGIKGIIFDTDLLILDKGKEFEGRMKYIIDIHLLESKLKE